MTKYTFYAIFNLKGYSLYFDRAGSDEWTFMHITCTKVHSSLNQRVTSMTERQEYTMYVGRDLWPSNGASIRLDSGGKMVTFDQLVDLRLAICDELDVEAAWEQRGGATYLIIHNARIADTELWRKVRDVLSRKLNTVVNLITMEQTLELIRELGGRNLMRVHDIVRGELAARDRCATAPKQ